MVQIYGLNDPWTGELRYIGKARDAERRLKGHMCERRRKSPLYDWIGKIRGLGLAPVLSVLVETDEASWREAERAAIDEARKRGERLLNLADGGDQPLCPPEVRAANGRKNAKARSDTPFKARVYQLNREVGRLLKQGRVSEANKDKLRRAAQKAPHLFGKWAAI